MPSISTVLLTVLISLAFISAAFAKKTNPSLKPPTFYKSSNFAYRPASVVYSNDAIQPDFGVLAGGPGAIANSQSQAPISFVSSTTSGFAYIDDSLWGSYGPKMAFDGKFVNSNIGRAPSSHSSLKQHWDNVRARIAVAEQKQKMKVSVDQMKKVSNVVEKPKNLNKFLDLSKLVVPVARPKYHAN